MFLGKVYVTLRPTVNDPQGQTIMGSLRNLGFDSVASVRAGKYMEIRIEEVERSVAEEQVRSMCRKLLANPVIEDYRFDLEEVPEPKSAPSA
jgi:phosphoribosylformylglycinamidine synthase